jgi:hypothetical protein
LHLHGEHPTIARMKTCWFHLMPYRFLPEHFENDLESPDAVANAAAKFLSS